MYFNSKILILSQSQSEEYGHSLSFVLFSIFVLSNLRLLYIIIMRRGSTNYEI